MLGHSVGEYAAAASAGVFSIEDGLKLIAQRGRLVQEQAPAGQMVSVAAEAAKIEPLLENYADRVSLAAHNGPQSTVVSGEPAAIAEIEARCAEEGLQCQRLAVSHAFHSPLMAPLAPRLPRNSPAGGLPRAADRAALEPDGPVGARR